MLNRMVQYGIWSDCTNNCDFCLRMNRKPYTKKEKIQWLDIISENIKEIDWVNDFPCGISLLGGELYYIRDKDIQSAFMNMIDTVIEYILKPSKTPLCKYSTVSNGIYKPDFLFQVIDHIAEEVGINRVDMNFSYDLKYRYKTEKSRLLAESTINAFQKRYNYCVGVQMILTQNVINLWKEGKFNTVDFMNEKFPNCQLSFLYPHKIHTGKILEDFYFKRADFLNFVQRLRYEDYPVYLNFINSCKNSGTFKYTGLRDRISEFSTEWKKQIPILSDGKEELTDCGHSILYRCYSDSDKCMLCDLMAMDSEL